MKLMRRLWARALTMHRVLRYAIPLLTLVTLWVGCQSDQLTRDTLFDPSGAKSGEVGRSATGALTATVRVSTEMIRPGDQIQVSVWGYPEFSVTSTLKESGTVTIPLVGEVLAVGLTKDQFAEQLKAKLTEYIKGEPKLTISISSLLTQRVTVMGAVTRQDNYPTLTEVSLVEILSTAGGATIDADLRHIKIFRNSNRRQSPLEVDLTAQMERGDMEGVPKVRPGDTVFVPRQENLIRELSEFVRDVLLLFGFFRLLN